MKIVINVENPAERNDRLKKKEWVDTYVKQHSDTKYCLSVVVNNEYGKAYDYDTQSDTKKLLDVVVGFIQPYIDEHLKQ